MPITSRYRSNFIYCLKTLHIYLYSLKISCTEVHIKHFGKFFVHYLSFLLILFFISLHRPSPFLSSDSFINCAFKDFIIWFSVSKNFLFTAYVQNSIELCFHINLNPIYSLCSIDFKLLSAFVLQIHFTNLSSIHSLLLLSVPYSVYSSI